MKREVELLAPAGSYDIAIAAINAGADAVYLGGENFGARANAENLKTEEIIDVLNYAHLNGRKVYLTINTLLKNKEIKNDLYDFLRPLYENGLDSVIVQDIGVLLFVKKYFPELKIHASTQMTIEGKETVKWLKNLGAKRVVLPRELSIDEIKDLKGTDIEIESFVHGALCYCYSGQCLLSSFIGGRSGNRGRCAQPCRLPYDVLYDGMLINESDEKYILSPKDICALYLLPDIIDAGVTSLKIEGRMKKKEYVCGVVSIYRKYLDAILDGKKFEVDENDIMLLMDLFNRHGFNESYYYTKNSREMISLKEPAFREENREYTDYLRDKYSNKILVKPLNINVKCKVGEPFEIFGEVDDEELKVEGAVVEEAQNMPLELETLNKHVNKTGNTDFVFADIEYDLDDNTFLPVSEINDVRRKYLDLAYEKALAKFKRECEEVEETKQEEECVETEDRIITVSVSSFDQLKETLSRDFVDRVYIDLNLFPFDDVLNGMELVKEGNRKVYLALPYVARKDDIKIIKDDYLKLIKQSDGVLIRNIEQYFYLKDLVDIDFVFDYNVYVWNDETKDYFKDFNVTSTVPVELNEAELIDRGVNGEEFIAYGFIPMMISANCAFKTLNRCEKNNDRYALSDKINNEFVVRCNCRHCYNVMYNCNATSLFKFKDDIEKLNPKSIRISLTNESAKLSSQVLDLTERAFVAGELVEDLPNTTRGHFKRGVL
ncbi:MAG: U32 family peptidase [Eubacterium sp.]|nr:U32 family peptidase [Eubacterium sp.]